MTQTEQLLTIKKYCDIISYVRVKIFYYKPKREYTIYRYKQYYNDELLFQIREITTYSYNELRLTTPTKTIALRRNFTIQPELDEKTFTTAWLNMRLLQAKCVQEYDRQLKIKRELNNRDKQI